MPSLSTQSNARNTLQLGMTTELLRPSLTFGFRRQLVNQHKVYNWGQRLGRNFFWVRHKPDFKAVERKAFLQGFIVSWFRTDGNYMGYALFLLKTLRFGIRNPFL